MSNNSANHSHSSEKPKRPRRTFSEDFEWYAVNLVVNEGYTKADAARAVNVGCKTFRDWHAKFAPEPEPCGEDATADQLKEENKRLRKQHRQVRLT
jgi:transposase